MQPARQSATTLPTQAQKEEAARWFTALRDRFHAALEAIEDEYETPTAPERLCPRRQPREQSERRKKMAVGEPWAS